jgi:hypothetical protein
MHHKRVVQEKNKLIVDIKRLRQHNAMHEPAMQGLQKRYELAMKEKAMARLERDKMLKKMEQLEATIAGMREGDGRQERAVPKKKKGVVDSVLPSDERVNPFLNAEFETTDVPKWSNTRTFKAHLAPISGIAVHPKKDIIATASDDSTWKVWSVPNGDLLMSGDGHKEWVSGIDFHPTAGVCTRACVRARACVRVYVCVRALCAINCHPNRSKAGDDVGRQHRQVLGPLAGQVHAYLHRALTGRGSAPVPVAPCRRMPSH